jgi:hypothetical protein
MIVSVFFAETLKLLSPLETSSLKELAVTSSSKHRHKKEIDDLIAHMETIAVNNS